MCSSQEQGQGEMPLSAIRTASHDIHVQPNVKLVGAVLGENPYRCGGVIERVGCVQVSQHSSCTMSYGVPTVTIPNLKQWASRWASTGCSRLHKMAAILCMGEGVINPKANPTSDPTRHSDPLFLKLMDFPGTQVPRPPSPQHHRTDRQSD